MSRPSKSGATRGGTRLRLIRAAVQLFQERGFHGTGTADILTAAGAPRGSLYHHFRSGKVELGCAAADWLADEVIGEIDRLRASGTAPADVAVSLASSTAAWLEGTHYRQGGLLASLTAGVGAEPALWPAITRAYQRIEQAHAAALSAAGMNDAQAAIWGRTLMAEFEGAMLLARVRRDSTLLTSQISNVAERIRAALSPSPLSS